MGGADARPITADSLRRRAEWKGVFPGAALIWEEAADEGHGIGFDRLDPSAMLRAFFSTPATWGEVIEWYRSILDAHGWEGKEFKPATWWQWTSAARSGEQIDVLDRGRWERMPGWPVPEERIGQLGFEVLFTARGGFSATWNPPDA